MNRPQNSRPHQSPEVRAGFTLIELLATMAVIAILSAAALPGIQSAIQTARQTQAAQHARGIGIALNSWAQDFEGIFPNREILESEGVSISSSNDVFRHLIPDLIDNERVFAVSASAWGQRADGRFSEGKALEPGENHFAYISGLLTTSRSFWPLIVDGTDGSGFYHTRVGEKGGAWGGRRAIVVRVDGSVTKERMKRDGEKRFIPRLDEDTENALGIDSYMPDGVELLDPAGEQFENSAPPTRIRCVESSSTPASPDPRNARTAGASPLDPDSGVAEGTDGAFGSRPHRS